MLPFLDWDDAQELADPDLGTVIAKSRKSPTKAERDQFMVHKDPKPKHHHKPAIERTVPIEQIIALFSQRFDEPYLNPMAELTFEAFANAFPNITREVLQEALSYWTNHSGQKLLQTKTIEGLGKDNRVWYVHGLSPPHLDESGSSSAGLGSH